jgi:DNA-directed RNA polymerase
MVHDSFATNPNRIDDLHTIIRNVVVDLFTEDYLDVLYNDWKSQLPSKLQTRLTPPPQRGNLDINKVKESLYFFS